MPEETIKRIEDLTPEERLNVDVAIVANPDPEDLNTLSNLKWVQSLWAGVEKMMEQFSNAPFEIVRLEDPEMAKPWQKPCLHGRYTCIAICQNTPNNNERTHGMSTISAWPAVKISEFWGLEI